VGPGGGGGFVIPILPLLCDGSGSDTTTTPVDTTPSNSDGESCWVKMQNFIDKECRPLENSPYPQYKDCMNDATSLWSDPRFFGHG